MNLKSLFDFRGTNTWIIALGVAANLLFSLFVLVFASIRVLEAGEGDAGTIYVVLILVEFIGTLLIGWFCGWLAFDDRGPTYGVFGALGSVAIIMLTLLASGWISIMLSIVALAGGFNGGTLSRYRGKRKTK